MAEKEELNKKLENELKKDIEKEVKQEIEGKLDKKLDKNLEKELKPQIEKEIKKRFHQKILEGTKESAVRFEKEFKNQLVIAITAAFGFLIALSWRNPIEAGINQFLESLNLKGGVFYWDFLSALVVTVLAVLVLIVISKWKSEEKK